MASQDRVQRSSSPTQDQVHMREREKESYWKPFNLPVYNMQAANVLDGLFN